MGREFPGAFGELWLPDRSRSRAAGARQADAADARIEYLALVQALTEDATVLSSRFARPVAERLGTAPAPTPEREAMWASDERHKAWAAEQLQRARELAQFGHVDQIALEARDLRPDPA